MSIYCINDGEIAPLESTTFSEQGVKERYDLQKMLKNRIDAISPETLIISEEYSDWEDSQSRIDLLGIDKDANIVVIELKRTEDGGYMDLQAIRYAAMISTMTFDKLVETYEDYLRRNGIEQSAKANLLKHLDWEDDANQESFAQEIKIVLASGGFKKELLTSVMWLNEQNLDIRCVRMIPHVFDGQLLLDIQTIIPIPEVADYQVRIREKKQKARESRQSARDFTKYDIRIGDSEWKACNKRKMMYLLVSAVVQKGGKPKQILECIPDRKFVVFEGALNSQQIKEQIMEKDRGGNVPRSSRFFCEEDEPFHIDDKTCVLSNQWGVDTLGCVNNFVEKFPNLKISYEATNE